MSRRVIGLSGYARCGKDTLADILVEKHGYTKISWADPLKRMLGELNPVVDEEWSCGEPFEVRVREAVTRLGWDGAKERIPEVRELLQRLGVAAREVLDPDVWVLALERSVIGNGYTRVVIPDCRFPNEAEWVQARGVLARITRPGVGPKNDHISEVALDGWPWDLRVPNAGKLADLEAWADNLDLHAEVKSDSLWG